MKGIFRLENILFFLLITSGVAFLAAREGAAFEKKDSTAPGRKTVLPPAVIEKYEYYEVCGCSENDLHCDLTKKGIKCDDGKKYDSVTDWKVKWDYDYSRSARACTVDSFRVTVEIIFRLPKWAPTPDAPAPQQLVDKWESYIKKLIMHEKGHRARAVEAAEELTHAVAELPPTRTCADLDREVRVLTRARTDKLIEAQREYDDLTNHGHTQGAVFP